MKLELEIEINGLRDLIRVAGFTIAAVAVLQELQRPPEMRTWRGEVGGMVPYDFRPPTIERIKAAYWNPVNPDLLTRTAFGIGWAVNLPVLMREAGSFTQQALGGARERLAARGLPI